MKIVEIRPNLLVREDGMVKNINPSNRSVYSHDWKPGSIWDKQKPYRTIYCGKKYSIHRLIAEAFIPNPHNYKFVDHIDGNPSNNSVDNLRWVTRRQNGANQVIHRNNSKSGGDNIPVGVSWDKSRDRWKVEISINNKSKFIGRYKTLDEAILARHNYEEKYDIN